MNLSAMALCFFFSVAPYAEPVWLCKVSSKNVRCYHSNELAEPVMMTKRNCEWSVRKYWGVCTKPTEDGECVPVDIPAKPEPPRPGGLNQPKW